MSMYDFSQVESVKESQYLKPGVYVLNPSDVKLEEGGKTPYLNITFSGTNGMVKQKFYLTAKALPNLQYLHEGFFGKPITKAFESNAQLEAYFQKALVGRKIEKPMIVGGQIAENGQLYSELPFGKFLIKEGVQFTEGEFDEKSPDYNRVVRKSSGSKTPGLSTDNTMLSDTVGGEDMNSDDMPW